MRGFKFILFFLVVQVTSLHAQWRGPVLDRLGPKDGMPSIINDIAQDSTGYLYFATNVGMYRYDGHHFEFFGHDPMDSASIGAGDVNSVRVTRDGMVWLALRYSGLSSYNPKTNEIRNYPLPELPFRSIPGAHTIYEDDAGTLWVGCTHFRLMTFDRKSEAYTIYSPEIDPVAHGGRLDILSIVADPKDPDLLWLSVLDYQSKGSTSNSYGTVSFRKSTTEFQDAPCYGNVRYCDAEGNLWGTYWAAVVSKFNTNTRECTTYKYGQELPEPWSLSVSMDIIPRDSHFLVASSKAIFDFDRHKTFTPLLLFGTNDPNFASMFVDRDKNIWIGSSQGAYIIDPGNQHIRFFSLEQYGTVARIYPGRLSYYAPDDVIYLAQANDNKSHRIYRVPLHESQNEEPRIIKTQFVVDGITADINNKIWVVGEGSLYTLSPETETLSRSSLFPNDEKIPWVWNLKSNTSGWVCGIGNDAFFWFHADTLQARMLQMSGFPGSSFAKSFDNSFGGCSLNERNTAYLFSNEIFKVDLISGNTTALKYDRMYNPDLLPVQYVGEDHTGNIWVSTVEVVAKFRLDGDSLIMQDVFTLKDGLSAPSALELYIDDNDRVWVYTSSGMNCIDPVSREVRFYGAKEGLPNTYIDPRKVIDAGRGRIATVCSNGLIVYDASVLWESSAIAEEQVVIKQIRIGGEAYKGEVSVNALSAIDLKPGQNLVDIEFQGLSYPTDYHMEYSYRIQGLEDNWISLGQNKLVTLSALAPGNYTFQVKSGNPGSQSPVKSLGIHMATPLYQQPWFILAVALAVGGIFFLVMHWRVRRVRKEEAQRSEINKKIAELELKALRSQMNPHFMFNSLNSIKNYILHAEPRLAAEYLSNFAHLIRLILHNSREKMISLQDELEALMLYIELERLRFDEEFEFSCTIDDNLHLENIRIPPMLLQPYVENAIWHGLMHKRDKGHLHLQFLKEGDMVACIVEDDGIGRAKAQEMKSLSAARYKSMGMGITQDRIDIMNKMDALGITAEIQDKYDADGNAAGTLVKVIIPATNGVLSEH